MRKLLFTGTIILLLSSHYLYAQQDSTKGRVWKLEECIKYATENNLTIKQLELQKENAEIQVNTSKMKRLPDLNGNFGQNWNFGRTLGNENIYVNQTISNTSFGLGSSTPLFTGFQIPNEIAKSKLDLEAATQNMEKAKEDLALNVASLYLQALFNKELLKISEEQLALSLLQVERTKTLVEVGKVPLSQLYDIEAQAAKDEASLVQSKNDLEASMLDLAQNLELERSHFFDIRVPETEELIEELMGNIYPPDNIYNAAISFKPVIKEQEYLLESAKKGLKIAESGYMPKLNLNLGYSTNYYFNYDQKGVVNPLTEEPINRSFSDQFKDNAGEYIGFSMSIPIFNRNQVRNQVRSAKVNILNQQLSLENAKKTLYKEIQTAYLNASASKEKYKASMRAVIATEESFKYARERYEIGKSSVFEFNEAKTKLIQSQSEQVQAKYDYIFRTKILDFYNGIPIKL